MVKKIKTCVFISGAGSNLKSIIESSRNYNFPIKVDLIISNNLHARGINLAKRYNILFKYFSSTNMDKFERKCLFEIKKKKYKIYMLGGFYENYFKIFYQEFW